MRNSQVYIRSLVLHNLVLRWVARKYVDAVSSTEAFQRAAMPALQVDLTIALVTASNPNPSMEEECWKSNLDMTMGEDARSLDM
jgi:hypothetical protein